MTDTPDIMGMLSALAGGGAKQPEAGGAAGSLAKALGDDPALAGHLAETLKNVDLSAIISALGGSGGAASGTSASGAAANGGETASGGASPNGGASPSGAAGGLFSALPSVLGSLSGKGDPRSAERRALYAAIRPFVSDRRKKAIDAIVGFEKLTAALPGVK